MDANEISQELAGQAALFGDDRKTAIAEDGSKTETETEPRTVAEMLDGLVAATGDDEAMFATLAPYTLDELAKLLDAAVHMTASVQAMAEIKRALFEVFKDDATVSEILSQAGQEMAN